MNNIYIDPETYDEVMDAALNDFDVTIEDMIADNECEHYDLVAWQEIAQQFYVNGYIHGAAEAVKNPDFADSVKLMNEEIEYQRKQKKE